MTAFATKPMQFEPGSKWQYSQTGINSLGRIIEVVSGKKYDEYVHQEIFEPLGMTDTTFYPSAELQKRIATSYKAENGKLTPTVVALFEGKDLADHNRVPLANGGLYSTAADYIRFAQMILNKGRAASGAHILAEDTVAMMAQKIRRMAPRRSVP